MWQAFIISMICDMPWIISPITRTAAAGGASNRISRARGFPAATIEEAWKNWRENGGEQDEQSMIRELLRKKHYDAAEAETDWKERQKIYAFLVKKGILRRKLSARPSVACIAMISENTG